MSFWHKNPYMTLSFDGMKCQQAVAGISHISFGEEEGVTPKKPTTIAEVAKLRELSGTLETEAEAEARLKKQLSESKYKELSGHDIFAPPPEILPRETTAPRQLALKGSIQIGEPTSPVYESAKVPKHIMLSFRISLFLCHLWKHLTDSKFGFCM